MFSPLSPRLAPRSSHICEAIRTASWQALAVGERVAMHWGQVLLTGWDVEGWQGS